MRSSCRHTSPKQIFVLYALLFQLLHTFMHYDMAEVLSHKGRTLRCHGNHIYSLGCSISECVFAQVFFRQELPGEKGRSEVELTLSPQRPERVPQTRWRADRLSETGLQPEQISRSSSRASPSSTWGHFTLAGIPSVWRRKRREQDSREGDKGEDVVSGRTRNVLK